MITQNYMTVAPAYGRDYKNSKLACADFAAGKDFMMMSVVCGGGYCSIADFAKGTIVNIRYDKMTKVTPYVV